MIRSDYGKVWPVGLFHSDDRAFWFLGPATRPVTPRTRRNAIEALKPPALTRREPCQPSSSVNARRCPGTSSAGAALSLARGREFVTQILEIVLEFFGELGGRDHVAGEA